MSPERLTSTALAAVILVAACGRSRTEGPVTTRTPEGKSVSPSGTAAASQGKSMVRLVNALANRSPVSLMADDSTLFTGVEPKAVTPYKEIKDNVVDFKLRGPADSTIANNHETMTDGARYTVVALPNDDATGVRLRVLRDEVVPDAGKARVRLINATAGDHKVDLAVQGSRDALFSGVRRGVEAGYKDVDPTKATLEVRSDQRGTRPVTIKNLDLHAGRAYTIVLVDRKSGGMDAITFDDATAGTTLSARDNR
jgi:hypothetical protein